MAAKRQVGAVVRNDSSWCRILTRRRPKPPCFTTSYSSLLVQIFDGTGAAVAAANQRSCHPAAAAIHCCCCCGGRVDRCRGGR